MECWQCERPAHAVCRFCGRGVCKTHAHSRPFITDIFRNAAGEYRAVAVADTIWCGICEPQEDPVGLKNLD